MFAPLLNVCWCFRSTIFHPSQIPQSFACSPLLVSILCAVADSQSDVFPSLSAHLHLSTKREHSGEAFHRDPQSQLDVTVVFLINTACACPAPPPALPECSTRWYSVVKSEAADAFEIEDALCVCAACLKVSSD